jgi:type IV pilus assembly protein PilN
MYSLDINFLKDRAPIQAPQGQGTKRSITLPVGNTTPMYIGVAIGVFFPALVAAGVWFLQGMNTELEQDIAQLEQQNQQLDTEIGNINKIKEEIKGIKSQTQALVSVFDQIRPWSAMLQDLRERIPGAVQIQNIRQIPPVAAAGGQPAPNPAGGVEIIGIARSFNDVNDFMLTLQQSSFFKSTETRILTAELINAPIQPNSTGIQIKPPSVVKYTIQSTLSDIPATELIRELERKGTVGLVSRIRTLQQTGVIKK